MSWGRSSKNSRGSTESDKRLRSCARIASQRKVSTMHWSIGQKVVVGYGLIFLMVATLGVVSLSSFESLAEANRWAAHTRDVTGVIEALWGNLTEAETVQRDYIIFD